MAETTRGGLELHFQPYRSKNFIIPFLEIMDTNISALSMLRKRYGDMKRMEYIISAKKILQRLTEKISE